MLLIDAANVVGARPDGWWRDRPGATRVFLQRVRDAVAAGRLAGPVIVVVEGVARRGVDEGVAGGVEVVHAPGSGDDSLVALAGTGVTAVTADRELRRRLVAAGAATVGPRWLLDRIE